MCSVTRSKIKNLKKQAKALKKVNDITMDEAQHHIAKLEGFPNWESLILAIEG